MNAGQPQNTPQRTYKVYFGIAGFLLFLLAFFWSLDASFVYFFLGAICIFLFLGFYKRPPSENSKRFSSSKQSYTAANAGSNMEGSSVFTEFEKIFKQEKIATPAGNPQPVFSNAGKTIIPFVIFFGISFIFVIAVSLIFADGESSSDSDVLYERAEQFRYNAQFDSADFYYNQVLATDPDNTKVLNGFGTSLFDQKKYDLALGIFDQVLLIDPDYEFARYNKALALHYKQNYKQSLKESLALMDLNPAYYDAMLLAGDNYYLQQRYDSAIYWYEEGYENGERSAALSHVMAFIYDTQGNSKKAVELYKEALSYDSTRIEIYTRLGELFPGQDGEVYRAGARTLKEKGY